MPQNPSLISSSPSQILPSLTLRRRQATPARAKRVRMRVCGACRLRKVRCERLYPTLFV
ncbi:hypothetical protein BT69DRAFT_314633 [Atractiella rhizophila]|nr:hypothetical protein BT69DRAFT_314633 [Atractiella rhizophila]